MSSTKHGSQPPLSTASESLKEHRGANQDRLGEIRAHLSEQVKATEYEICKKIVLIEKLTNEIMDLQRFSGTLGEK